MDRDELATFLRDRRARVRPQDLGLDAGTRRRVPGLRRQEVANLAGMSIDYYIRLEQARGPRPSREILTAIARALQLSDAERGYLFNLAGEPAPQRPGPARDVRPGVLRMLDQLDSAPALVCDGYFYVLAWNRMAAALLGDYGSRPVEERNVIERFFTDPAARARHDGPGAQEFANAAVADLRAARARYPDDPRLRRLLDRLTRNSAEFRELWSQREVFAVRSAAKRIRHPSLGWLDLDCEALHDPERDHWVIVYTATPGTSAHEALQLLRVIGTQQLDHAPQ